MVIVSAVVHQAAALCLVLLLTATTVGAESAERNTTTTTTTAASSGSSSEHHPDEEDASVVVVDLSQPWEESPLYNQNKAYCNIQSVMVPFLNEGYVIVQDGLLVAEGYVNDNTPKDIHEAFSVTKSFSTMIVGKMVELNLVFIEDTLDDIFNLDSDWVGVDQATEMKTIRLEELLTMTSGLVSGDGDPDTDQDTLQDVLNFNEYKVEEKGKFNYLGASHILSRIILRRSGLTPREFVTQNNLFSKLGIDEADYDWQQFGGVEGTAFGLETNPRSLAKLGQLYLQNGLVAEGDQMIPETWVEWSVTDQLSEDTAAVQCLIPGYGYQWYTDRKDRSDDFLVPIPELEGAFAANGILGQQIIVIPRTNTVIAIMGSDPTIIYNYAFSIIILENLHLLDAAVNEEAIETCGDFSIFRAAFQTPYAVGLGIVKILTNLILE